VVANVLVHARQDASAKAEASPGQPERQRRREARPVRGTVHRPLVLATTVHVVGPVLTKSAGGWETAVAIASILAALATVGLAVFTARLASRTTELARQTKALAQETAADIAGQHRPIITTLPDLGARYSANEAGTLEMHLYNSGSGPALDVQTTLMQPGAEGRAPQEWHKGALPGGREFPVKFWEVRRPTPQEDFSIEVSYRDLDGRSYTSIVEIRCIDSIPLDEPKATLQIMDIKIETATP
jgi:hypothetical protein